MTRPIRVLSYAVNGQGLGHLTRLLAVNRWLRRIARTAGISVELVFLTSSEADDLCFRERIASFKVPSKTAARESGFDPTAYAALARQWTWTAVSTLRPDILLVDTFPRGAFGELQGVLELCRTRAFIHRTVDDAFADQPEFRAMLPLYDLVVVPDEPGGLGAAGTWAAAPPGLEGRVRVVPPIIGTERADMLGRDEARRALGAEPDDLVVLATTGGGGNEHGSRVLHAIAERLAQQPRVHLVIGAGPLERSDDVLSAAAGRANITVWRAPELGRLFAGVDVAVAAAGYNTFHELMQAGVPTIFVPQTRLVDDQLGRCLAAAEHGAAVVLDAQAPIDAIELALEAAFEPLRNAETRAQMAARACALVGENGARVAAAAVLQLVASPDLVRRALDAISDEMVRLDRTPGALDRLLKLARLLEGSGVVPGPTSLTAARGILDDVDALPTPLAAGRTAEMWLSRLRRGDVEARAGSTHAALRLLDRGDWTAATTLLRALVVEHELEAVDLVDALSMLLDVADACAIDLYRCVAFVAAHDDENAAAGMPSTNRARIADACARMRAHADVRPAAAASDDAARPVS